MKSKILKPAIFLDRDGTILNERGYLSHPKNLRFYPPTFKALLRLQKSGFSLVLLTNQSGIARGLLTLGDLAKIHSRLKQRLAQSGVKLSGIYFCPHLPKAGCSCRKPKPGMAIKAAKDLGLDLKKSFVIGDQTKDMKLAGRIKSKGILVLTGAGRSLRNEAGRFATKMTSNLSTAANWVLKTIQD